MFQTTMSRGYWRILAGRNRSTNGSPEAGLQNPLHRRLPDELVDLQSQTHVQPVLKNPFRQQARIKLRIGCIALRAGVLLNAGEKITLFTMLSNPF